MKRAIHATQTSQRGGEAPTDGASRARGTDSKVSRAETVYRGLRRAIIEQALSPGTKLPEDLIGKRFGVSRTVVRAALARLAAESLVELHLNRGATVAHPSLDEAHDVFDIRRSLERLVVERLAGRLSRADRGAPESACRRRGAGEGRGGAESIRLAGEFHMLLAELAGSSIAVALCRRTDLAQLADPGDLRPAAFSRLRGRPSIARSSMRWFAAKRPPPRA